MPTPTNSSDKCIALAPRAIELEKRYPGIRCTVSYTEYAPDKWLPGHALWLVSIYSDSLERLVRYGLATAEQFEREALEMSGKVRRRKVTNEFGDTVGFQHVDPNCWQVYTCIIDYQNEEKPFTKKLQAETARMLKQFAKPSARGAMRDLERRAARACCPFLKPQAG
ncbi:MAG TPA: hypothetical protein VK635_34305 [Bradyrhizobium sp.]|nr:hypothetical protein [Bradyrhizobium sp.]